MDKLATMFQAHLCTAFGDYRNLTVSELPFPRVSYDELLVRNQAFAIGFPDILTIQGKYQRKPTLPFVPGSEFCGEVAGLGEGVNQFFVGDLVMGTVLTGAYAEMVVVSAQNCLPLPQKFDVVQKNKLTYPLEIFDYKCELCFL